MAPADLSLDPNLYLVSHLRMAPLAQDAPAGQISQVIESDTLVVRLAFHLFLGLNPGLEKKIGVALKD